MVIIITVYTMYLVCLIHAPGVQKKIFKEIHVMCFHCLTYYEPLSRGVMKFTIFFRLFLGHHYYKLTLSDPCLGVEKIFREKHKFYTFNPKIISP